MSFVRPLVFDSSVCFHKHTQIWLIWLLLLFPVLFFFYKTFLLWFFWLIVLISFNALCIVQALSDVAETLGQTNWNFNVDPCSGQGLKIPKIMPPAIATSSMVPSATLSACMCLFLSLSLSHAHHIYNTTCTPNIICQTSEPPKYCVTFFDDAPEVL